jgi:tetratricopeptide (TPR) repeat protein
METIFPEEVECGLCGVISMQFIAPPAGKQMGLPDLDTRPVHMSTIALGNRIQCCSNCGYCAPDISIEFPSAQETVHGESYKRLLKSRTLPELARYFMAWATIQEAAQEYPGAGWACLNAAWICDDEEETFQAEHCRQRAIRNFLQAREAKRSFSLDIGTEEVLLADLYRRTGQFAKARRIGQQGLELDPDDLITSLLRFEQMLADQEDRGRHSVNAVPGIQE